MGAGPLGRGALHSDGGAARGAEVSRAERVVVASLVALRLLSGDILRWRRELLWLRDLVAELGAAAPILGCDDEGLRDR